MNHPSAASRLVAIAIAAALWSCGAAAETDVVAQLQERWAEVKYEVSEDARGAAFEALARQAADARTAQPQDARVLIWEGIILASYAGEKGGFGALSLCKQARKDFEAAIAIDPTAMHGSAFTSLGSLYYQVPGWPVGFGDEDKARELLTKGLELDPAGIDSNYFYGDFLRDQGEYELAVEALQRALQAPARPQRELADHGRRGEIEAALAEARRHADG